MNFLATIIEEKRREVARAKTAHPIEQLRRSKHYGRRCLSLRSALLSPEFGIIAEVKKASPSKGLLREDFRPVEIARSYQRGGAAALSILTDEKFFQGSLAHLAAIRETVDLPLLRKDFVIDAYQLHQAKAAGADAVLLIVAALTVSELGTLQREAADLGLESLVEVHTREELSVAGEAVATLIGINNRDLDTFETDLLTSVRLSAGLPAGTIGIAESAISTSSDLDMLKNSGLKGALIGEAFMRAADPGEELAKLIHGMKK